MIEYQNSCCGCPGLECMGRSCPHKKDYPVLKCDICGAETDLYYYDGREMCIDCIAAELEPVEIDEGE